MANMTVKDVYKTIGAIEAKREDDETAHILEDALHQAVLRAIADGECDHPNLVAAAALQTNSISFSRWCA